jgi:release factor glutamine methyltransferase
MLTVRNASLLHTLRRIQFIMPLTIEEFLRLAAQKLEAISPSPRLDAEVLAMHVCGLDRSALITRAHAELEATQQKELDYLLALRQRGEPIAYLTGTREFWSMALNVSPATLIPRPETELLVEKALALIPPETTWTIADLGTGTGAVALVVAKERPRCRVIATDFLPAALNVARSNVKKFALTNVELRQGDWFIPLAGEKLDMIVSNPPYVCANDPHLQQGDVRFEPMSALASGADGLDTIRQIAAQAQQFLKPGGRLLLEHGFDQADAVAGLLRQQGYRDIVSHRDLSGNHRVTECRQ